jgi:hypothetical protein
MDNKRTYPEPDSEEGFLYVREWEDQRLKREWLFLLSLFHDVTGELAFRADNPEHRTGTANIPPSYTELYELSDELALYSAQFPGARAMSPDSDRD